MNESVRLGRIAGVAVGINWSLAVIAVLVAMGLAAGRYPLLHPGLPAGAYLVAGAVSAVLLFASILAHELAHAIVARGHGVGVDGITLWLFGGVARMTSEAPTPAAELRIAGVGPLVSLAVAAGAGVAAGLLDLLQAPALVVGVATWLAIINLVLAAFNLIPAAPLDGGRILRAFLWQRRGDPVASAVTAARAGRAFGFFLVAFGLLNFARGAGLGGLWLVLIGWFLVNAARAEELTAGLRDTLGDLRACDIMSPDPVMVPPDVTAARLVEDYLFRHRFSAFPVGTTPDTVEGLVTLTQIRALPPLQRDRTAVRELLIRRDEVAIDADAPVADVLPRLDGGRRVLVFDDGRLVGIISPVDVLRATVLAESRLRPERRQVA